MCVLYLWLFVSVLEIVLLVMNCLFIRCIVMLMFLWISGLLLWLIRCVSVDDRFVLLLVVMSLLVIISF